MSHPVFLRVGVGLADLAAETRVKPSDLPARIQAALVKTGRIREITVQNVGGRRIHRIFMKRVAWRFVRLSRVFLVLFFSGLSMLGAQEIGNGLKFNFAAQEAPGPGSPGPGALAAPVQRPAAIEGTVGDGQGSVIPGIPVTLAGQNNGVIRTVTANNEGAFAFIGLFPGTYRVKIDVAGLEPFVSDELVVGAREKRELPIVVRRIPKQTTTVQVTATLNEVAQAQVHEQEKQRVLGFLPDYYTSYIWTAAPMTPKLKFHLALRSAVDPVTFLVTAGLAGIEQKHNTFPGYGQGAEGYAKRFGAAYADTMSTRMIGRALLPTVLHQDPRYFYQGSGSIRSRISHALAASFVCRGDNGRLQPNYSQLLGNFAAAGLSNVYRAPGDRQVGLTFRNGLIITGTSVVENVLREFLSRKLTPHVPGFANGKP